jgi:hypothetical protein
MEYVRAGCRGRVSKGKGGRGRFANAGRGGLFLCLINPIIVMGDCSSALGNDKRMAFSGEDKRSIKAVERMIRVIK